MALVYPFSSLRASEISIFDPNSNQYLLRTHVEDNGTKDLNFQSSTTAGQNLNGKQVVLKNSETGEVIFQTVSRTPGLASFRSVPSGDYRLLIVAETQVSYLKQTQPELSDAELIAAISEAQKARVEAEPEVRSSSLGEAETSEIDADWDQPFNNDEEALDLASKVLRNSQDTTTEESATSLNYSRDTGSLTERSNLDQSNQATDDFLTEKPLTAFEVASAERDTLDEIDTSTTRTLREEESDPSLVFIAEAEALQLTAASELVSVGSSTSSSGEDSLMKIKNDEVVAGLDVSKPVSISATGGGELEEMSEAPPMPEQDLPALSAS